MDSTPQPTPSPTTQPPEVPAPPYDPLAPTTPPPATVPPTPQKPSHKKAFIAFGIAVLVIIIAVVLALFLMKDSKPTTDSATKSSASSPSQQTSAPTASTPASKIDAELSQFSYTPKSDNANDYVDKLSFYIDADTFTWAKADQTQVYKFADDSAARGSGDYCATWQATYGKYYADARQAFVDDQFDVKDIHQYTQFNNCGQGFAAVKESEYCSVYYEYIAATPDKYIGMHTNCSPESSIETAISNGQKIKLIYADIEPGYNLKGDMIDTAEYIKDSNTSGYQIAEIHALATDLYAYKAGSGKWQEVGNGGGGLFCSPTTADGVKDPQEVRKAFVGQACDGEQGARGTMTL